MYLQGRLQTRKWQDQTGNDRYSTEIVANEMQLMGGRDSAAGAPQGGGYQNQAQPQSQGQAQPQSQGQPQGQQQQQQQNQYQQPQRSAPAPQSPPMQAFEDFDDDIPF